MEEHFPQAEVYFIPYVRSFAKSEHERPLGTHLIQTDPNLAIDCAQLRL